MDSKLKYLFGADIYNWYYDESYLMFVTPIQIREIISQLITDKFQPKLIWDMFAGIGCDSITIQKYTNAEIISTELNTDTFSNLTSNLKYHNASITAYNTDCSTFIPDKAPDLVYFDPPWGDLFVSGREFDFNSVYLSNGKNVIELLREILKLYKNVCVKAPFDCMTFEIEFDTQIIAIYAFQKPKLKFLFLQAHHLDLELGA